MRVEILSLGGPWSEVTTPSQLLHMVVMLWAMGNMHCIPAEGKLHCMQIVHVVQQSLQLVHHSIDHAALQSNVLHERSTLQMTGMVLVQCIERYQTHSSANK